MFLAWNEIKHSKLKYVLVVGVMFLIAYLVFFLTGLAFGLSQSNRTAVDKWDADAIVLSDDSNKLLAMSIFPLSDMDEIDAAEKASLNQMSAVAQLENDESDDKVNISILGVNPDEFLMPNITEGDAFENTNEVVVNDSVKEEYNFNIGDDIKIAGSDEILTIVGFTDKAELSVAPVFYINREDFTNLRPATGMQAAEEEINAVVLRATDGDLNTVSVDSSELDLIPINDFIEKLPGYTAQNLTFVIMIVFLIVIAAIVIGIFIYVLTLQKRNIFGVLKAQGISNGVLARSVIAQTFLLSLIGMIIGFLATFGTSLGLPAAVPFENNWLFYGATAVLIIICAVLGAIFSVISITKIDPLEALNS